MCIFKNIHLCYFSVKNLPLCNFFMLLHLRLGPQFAGAQSAMGQFAGGQYAGETANWALESEGPNLPGLRFVLSLTRFTGPSTPTVIDRPVPELGEVGSRVAAASCLLLNKWCWCCWCLCDDDCKIMSKRTCPAKITLWASSCWPSSQARVTSAKLLSSFKFPKAQLFHSYWQNILSEKYEEPLQNTTFHLEGTGQN